MTYTFSLNKASFASHPALYKKLEGFLMNTTVSSEKEYNMFIHSLIVTLKKENSSAASSLFTKESKQLSIASPLIEKTPWGGVSIKKVNTAKDFIQKLLIIKQHGILGFEIHNKKLEKLHVLEGVCLFLSSQHKDKLWKKGKVVISLGKKGTRVVIHPRDEHGIIALTNCVIEETSTNNLGDLVFIFPSKQIL